MSLEWSENAGSWNTTRANINWTAPLAPLYVNKKASDKRNAAPTLFTRGKSISVAASLAPSTDA